MKVQKNIPLPRKWPFADMKVGDSFAMPADVKRVAVSVAAMRYGRKHGMKFTIRQIADKTFRCWRIE
jgi:hypothetical protein